MRHDELAHVLITIMALTKGEKAIVLGSQAVLGGIAREQAQLLDDAAKQALFQSMEVDVAFPGRLDLSALVDDTIGLDSPFYERFGYHAEGVEMEIAVLPRGWEQRLTPFTDQDKSLLGYCLDLHDLATAKLAAGRNKDEQFIQALVRAKLLHRDVLKTRILSTTLPEDRKELLAQRAALFFEPEDS
ncbi:DUF6036 family nucleotidyltransferase [Desulfonatronum parangueonense]